MWASGRRRGCEGCGGGGGRTRGARAMEHEVNQWWWLGLTYSRRCARSAPAATAAADADEYMMEGMGRETRRFPGPRKSCRKPAPNGGGGGPGHGPCLHHPIPLTAHPSFARIATAQNSMCEYAAEAADVQLPMRPIGLLARAPRLGVQARAGLRQAFGFAGHANCCSVSNAATSPWP